MQINNIEKLLEYYNKGLENYKLGDFKSALNFFQQALETQPGDGPSQMYVERCNEYIKSPPPEDWDGVYVMKTK
ncbi:MAG: tetratricopeptide repeat protein [Spirochaetota bacterium]